MALPALLVAGVVGLAAVGGTTVAVMASAGETAVVQRVVDGDTFDALSEDGRTMRVRLLNVDTPETKDPNRPVECLGPEASARLGQLLPSGSTVTLERDSETVDGYGRELAGVTNADGVLVNAELAREGLGVPMVVGGNDRFEPQVVAANQEARTARRGLYAESVTCTLPGQVAAVEAAAQPWSYVPATPEQWDAQAARLEGIASEARAVLARFDGPRVGVTWTAFSVSEQEGLRLRTRAVADDAAGDAGISRGRASDQREQAAAQQRAQEEAARQAEREQEAREEADRQARAQARADEQARRRAAATASDDSSSSSSPRASSSASGSAYPGYTGPRCYAPGGRTWRPC
ncbi:hypothetical protein GCM10023200_32500 [Actinomycetospora chlora]|uniref:TNase-like domain-containing protein n=1 Tax=Actinomycetospora chlora TaxID=663608 RepID=A0ABP9BE24_9PSEU